MPPISKVMRTPMVKIGIAGVVIALVAVAFFKLPPAFKDLLIFACGLSAFAVIIYQFVTMFRENYSESMGLVPSLKREPEVEQPNGLPPGEMIILEWATECLRAGNSLEAGGKLERISPEYRSHPAVLALRYEIYKQEQRWHAALDAARAYTKAAPDKSFGWLEQAVCLQEMKFTQRAVNTLLSVVDRFPQDAQIPYHLARFMSEMGRLEGSHRWLFKALEIGDKAQLATQAVAEPDFEPLLHFLGRKALAEKVVAGGLTGAERAALDFAIARGIPYGGWCPNSRAGEDGLMHKHYNLAATPSSGYIQRTEWNVRDSDGTVIFSLGPELTGAPSRTAEFTHTYHKPCLHLFRKGSAKEQVNKLLTFIDQHQIRTLNVTGSSASREPHVGDFVKEVLQAAYTLRLRQVLVGT